MMLEDFTYVLPVFVGMGIYMWWASGRQKAMTAVSRESQDLNRQAQELIRESIRVQTESNQLMRELIGALQQGR